VGLQDRLRLQRTDLNPVAVDFFLLPRGEAVISTSLLYLITVVTARGVSTEETVSVVSGLLLCVDECESV
jgi:hypothetical protein